MQKIKNLMGVTWVDKDTLNFNFKKNKNIKYKIQQRASFDDLYYGIDDDKRLVSALVFSDKIYLEVDGKTIAHNECESNITNSRKHNIKITYDDGVFKIISEIETIDETANKFVNVFNENYAVLECQTIKDSHITKSIIINSFEAKQKKDNTGDRSKKINISLKKDLFISDCIIVDKMYSKVAETMFKVNILSCIFLSEFDLVNIKFHNSLKIKAATFRKRFSLRKSVFFKKVYLKQTIFESELYFDNTEFKSMVEIYKAHIFKPVNFYRTVFRESVIIKYCLFMSNTIFLNTYVYKKLLIIRTKFKTSINLAHLNFVDNGSIETHDIKLPLFGLPSSDISYNLDKKQSAWKKTPYYKDVQETYRVLKNISIKQGNNIDALDLYKQECQNHNRSLWWFKDFGNKLTLFFEQNISYYGTSVTRAFLWFVAINYIMFTDSFAYIHYFVITVVAVELSQMLLRMLKIVFRISYSSWVTRLLVLVLDYKYIAIIGSIIAYIIYLKYLDSLQVPTSTWESFKQLFVDMFMSVKDLGEHLSNIVLDHEKWQNQMGGFMNGFVSSMVPFASTINELKGSISQLIMHLAINSVFVYQIIKSLRKYSRKL